MEPKGCKSYRPDSYASIKHHALFLMAELEDVTVQPAPTLRRAHALSRGIRRSFAHVPALRSSELGRPDSYASINLSVPVLMAELLQHIFFKLVYCII